MRAIAIGLAALLISSAAFSADIQANSSQRKDPKSAAAHVPQWAPAEFASGDLLPKKYDGVDRRRFYELFLQKMAKVKGKDEYETTEEYEKRKGSVSSLLSPINGEAQYAFLVDGIAFVYNADSESFSPERGHLKGSLYNCLTGYLENRRTKDYLVCEIGDVKTSSEKYNAKDARGRLIEVMKSNDRSLGLAISPDDPIYKKYFEAESVRRNGFYYEISMPRDEAAALRNSHINVLFVGNVVKAEVPKYTTSTSPTREFPYDLYNETSAVPFKLSKIIVYIYETGKILSTLDGSSSVVAEQVSGGSDGDSTNSLEGRRP